MNAVCLFSGHVSLVPYGPEHDERTVRWLNDPVLRSTFGLSAPPTLSSHRAWVEVTTDVLMWAIRAEGNSHIGNVLLHCNQRHRAAYFQIYLGEASARARGTGSQALSVVLWYAFEQLGLHRVWLHTLQGNAAAEKLYRNAGFLQEGIEREVVLRDGVFVSQNRWSLLRPEWSASQSGVRR